MGAAADVLRALNAGEPRDTLLSRVARHTCTLVRTDSCSVMLLDGDRLVLRAGHALTSRYRDGLEARAPLLVHPRGDESDLPAAQAVRERRTVVLRDVTATDIRWPWRELALAEGIRSVLAVPLGDAGVLVGYTSRVRDFAPDELAAAELMAQYAGTVLTTAELRTAQQETIRRLEWVEAQDRKLVRLLLDDAGLDAVLEALAGALAASVTLEAPEGTVLGRAGPELVGVPPSARAGRALRRALATVDDRRTMVRAPVGRGARAWVAPIVVGNELAARLWVGRPEGGEDADRAVIERFSLLVALELLKRRRAAETELRLTRDLAVELVSGTSDERSLLDRARALHHDLERPHTLVLMPAGSEVGGRLGRSLLRGEHEGALLVLVAGEDRARIATAVRDVAGTVVIGPTVRTTGAYPAAWRMTRTAAALADAPGVVDLERLGVAALLLETGTPHGLCRLADDRLGPLEEHDRARGTALVATLRAWVRSGCSTADTARALHLHPHTVAYRLRRIAELGDTDPRRQEGLFELQAALMVRSVQRASGS